MKPLLAALSLKALAWESSKTYLWFRNSSSKLFPLMLTFIPGLSTVPIIKSFIRLERSDHFWNLSNKRKSISAKRRLYLTTLLKPAALIQQKKRDHHNLAFLFNLKCRSYSWTLIIFMFFLSFKKAIIPGTMEMAMIANNTIEKLSLITGRFPKKYPPPRNKLTHRNPPRML